MLPPHCYVCGLDLRDVPDGQDLSSTFTLVHFALSREAEAAQEARARAGWVGHLENAVWFCNGHVELAQALAHLHWLEAKALIDAELPQRP
ncbi:hypothetical protein [Actinomadura sp. HBU206391]|uniref:hypothetical protein n=1 Tax=Actinomadura sp. HBU206391 TaxID=2731692 RepID=UPI0016501918|nr:hypothetical protein [Actinomadura sp. HBU206391]